MLISVEWIVLETYIMYVEGTHISKQNCMLSLTSLQWPAGPSQHLDNYDTKGRRLGLEKWGNVGNMFSYQSGEFTDHMVTIINNTVLYT